MAVLSLTLFGGFSATRPSGVPVVLPTKKSQALLAYCALHPGQAHRREKLATLLWAETEEANARTSLRQTLFVLRSALGGNLSRVLDIERDAITADSRAIEADALTFERLLGEGTAESLEKAAALYRGDLLDGFIVDEEPFEEWLLQERERLRDLAMEILARLLQHQRAQRLTNDAIRTAKRLLALDPLQEAVHRALMGLLFASGRRDEALKQYEICRGELKRQLNLKPEAETRQLRDAILVGRFGPARLPGRGGDFASRGPSEEEISGVSAVKAPDEAGSLPVASPLTSRAARMTEVNVAYNELSVRLKREAEEARRIARESREQRLALRQALHENIGHVTASRTLLVGALARMSARVSFATSA